LAKGVVTLLERDRPDIQDIQLRIIALQAVILEARDSLVFAREDNQRLLARLQEKEQLLRIVEELSAEGYVGRWHGHGRSPW
jgi:hypothetical protein